MEFGKMTKTSRKRKNLLKKRESNNAAAAAAGASTTAPSISEETLSTGSVSDEEQKSSSTNSDDLCHGQGQVNLVETHTERSNLPNLERVDVDVVQNNEQIYNEMSPSKPCDSENGPKCRKDEVSEDENSSGTPLMLIVGPEKYTLNLAKVFEATILQNEIKLALRTTLKLVPDDATKWRNENLARILFVIDFSRGDRNSFREIDETLSILSKTYLMSMDFIDFILAKESTNRNPRYARESSIPAGDFHGFVQKYGRPLITVVFERGWEHDQELVTILNNTFLNHFLPPGVPICLTP